MPTAARLLGGLRMLAFAWLIEAASAERSELQIIERLLTHAGLAGTFVEIVLNRDAHEAARTYDWGDSVAARIERTAMDQAVGWQGYCITDDLQQVFAVPPCVNSRPELRPWLRLNWLGKNKHSNSAQSIIYCNILYDNKKVICS